MNITPVTRQNYDAFIRSARVVVILFDAPAWNVRGFATIEPLFHEAVSEFAGEVAFGFVDTDREPEISRALPVLNVPLVAYYRDGQLVAKLISQSQDVAARTRAVMFGGEIGNWDGWGSVPSARLK